MPSTTKCHQSSSDDFGSSLVVIFMSESRLINERWNDDTVLSPTKCRDHILITKKEDNGNDLRKLKEEGSIVATERRLFGR